jgi:hypothetical protein
MKAVALSPILLFVVVSACASLSPQAKAVLDADDHLVANCKFLGNVHGSSGWGGLMGSLGASNAMKGARENAAELGATHVVRTSEESGAFMASVWVRAYQCAPPTEVADGRRVAVASIVHNEILPLRGYARSADLAETERLSEYCWAHAT